MDSAVIEMKTAAQAGPLRSGKMEYQSNGNSQLQAYPEVKCSAIARRFPIIARHFGPDVFIGGRPDV